MLEDDINEALDKAINNYVSSLSLLDMREIISNDMSGYLFKDGDKSEVDAFIDEYGDK